MPNKTVTIPVDFGYAYDYLAILCVKEAGGLIDGDLVAQCSNHIEKQVGHDLHVKIMESREFIECFNVNERVFQAVDKAKVDKVSASTVHNLNHQRFIAKKILQTSYFPDTEVTEKKN